MSSTISTWLTGPGARSAIACCQAAPSLCVGHSAAANSSASKTPAHGNTNFHDGSPSPSTCRRRATITASGRNSGRMYSGSRERERQNTSSGSQTHSASSRPARSDSRPAGVRHADACAGSERSHRHSGRHHGIVPSSRVGA